jgi:hypothetical protein
MTYYSMKTYKLIGFDISHRRGKQYDGILIRLKDKKIIRVPFGERD